MKKRLCCLITSFILLTSTIGCSLQSLASQEAVVGAAAGTAIGAGVGFAIGQSVGEVAINTVVNAGIGLGVGLLAGAIINEIMSREQVQVAMRQAEAINKQQQEIERLRQEVNESTYYGKGETKPWNERYWDDYSGHPFEASTGSFAY